MNSFQWANAATVEDAVKLLKPTDPKADPDEKPHAMGGGQDLLTSLKAYIVRPPRVVNLKTIQGLDKIEVDDKGLKIGATATIDQLSDHDQVKSKFPGLAEAARSIGSPQIRNLGTVGGNLCQRPRCWYFRNEHVHCLKKGGDRCYAAPENAENKYHNILGGGPCHIVHPSDLAPALTSLGAIVHVTSKSGDRAVPIAKFYDLPSNGSIMQETVPQTTFWVCRWPPSVTFRVSRPWRSMEPRCGRSGRSFQRSWMPTDLR